LPVALVLAVLNHALQLAAASDFDAPYVGLGSKGEIPG
jgi:hypothetical protein